jgi:hypothetical protein
LRIRLLILLAVCFVTGCSSVQEAPDATDRNEAETIGLYQLAGELRTVEVTIQDSKFQLLFDSAGGLTMITPKVAEEIDCVPFGRVVGFRMSGERVNLESCGEFPITLGGTTVKTELFVSDLNTMTPDDFPRIDGVVSLHTFIGHAITIDVSNNTLILENEASLSRRTSEMIPIETRYSRQASGAALDILVPIESSIGPLWFELDSGYPGPVPMPAHSQEYLGIELFPDRATQIEVKIQGAGALEFPAHEWDIIYDGVLGAAAMEQMVITLDLANHKAWVLTRN